MSEITIEVRGPGWSIPEQTLHVFKAPVVPHTYSKITINNIVYLITEVSWDYESVRYVGYGTTNLIAILWVTTEWRTELPQWGGPAGINVRGSQS